MVDDDGIATKERKPRLIAEHRIVALVAGASLVGVLFAVLGLGLYHAGGSAQVDLSRPGYAGGAAVERIDEDTMKGFPASGPVDKAMIVEFDALFQAQLDEVHKVDAFSGDPMALDSLGIDSGLGSSSE